MALAPLEGARETTRLVWGLAQSLGFAGVRTATLARGFSGPVGR